MNKEEGKSIREKELFMNMGQLLRNYKRHKLPFRLRLSYYKAVPLFI